MWFGPIVLFRYPSVQTKYRRIAKGMCFKIARSVKYILLLHQFIYTPNRSDRHVAFVFLISILSPVHVNEWDRNWENMFKVLVSWHWLHSITVQHKKKTLHYILLYRCKLKRTPDYVFSDEMIDFIHLVYYTECAVHGLLVTIIIIFIILVLYNR